MTSRIPESHEQMADLLPIYINGRLPEASARQIREHLLSCKACQQELANWDLIKSAARLVLASTALPSVQLMDNVWAKIDAPADKTQMARPWSPGRALHRLWLVFRTQIPLIHKSIWVASALVGLFGLTMTMMMASRIYKSAQIQVASQWLVLCIVVVGASGCAFIYGSSIDPGFEWTISTPTSVRLLMLCRMVIVMGYNFLLGMLASAVFAAVYGDSLWGMVQLWLGPLFFFSSFCLTISLFLGSTFALICAAVIEMLQNFPPISASHLISQLLPSLDLGATSPALLIATLALIAFAVCFIPRQPRLAG